MSRNDFLWVETYRPKVIDDCILPENIKKTFKEFVEKGEIPNLLLSGPPGIGKTTVAKALCNELGVDSYVINGSDEGRFLDTVRNHAKNFASTVSLQGNGRPKVIIIDEADNTTNDVQLLLRANIETFYNNCRFIFTCNYKNKIIEPLHSRCAVFDFSIPGKTKPLLASEFFNRVRQILVKEGITYDERVVAEVIQKYFPDWRRVLNELQRYASGGVIDTGILTSIGDVNLKGVIQSLKDKNFANVRKWVVENLDNDVSSVIRKIYDAMYSSLEPQSIPQAVLILARYQYQSAFVADQEINTLACFTEIMCDCKFK
jgi:DNA polymerase III delta prime subunit